LSKKCLILYASHTGNTEKVALRFKGTFEKHGWQVDAVKLNQKSDLMHPTYDFNNYDFCCIGAGIELHEPFSEIVAAMRIPRYGFDPKKPHSERPPRKPPEEHGEGKGQGQSMAHLRIEFGPDSKKAVVFVTYSGFDLGPKECIPALELLALEVEHLKFQCIGKFSCLGKFVNGPTPEAFWGDIRDRPNENDLKKADIFIEDILAEIRDQDRK